MPEPNKYFPRFSEDWLQRLSEEGFAAEGKGSHLATSPEGSPLGKKPECLLQCFPCPQQHWLIESLEK